MAGIRWRVRISTTAERDIEGILRWTGEAFGSQQAQVYADLLAAALGRLLDGPEPPGSKARDEILLGLRTFHVGRPGRHFVLYRAPSLGVIEVVRVLHDAMELERHLPPREPGPET